LFGRDEVVFLPVDAISDRYNLEQDEDQEFRDFIAWLEEDIHARGLQHPIKVAESKRKGEYDGINGKKRRRAIARLHKKGISIRFKGHPIPKGKIPAELSKLTGADAALEALCDNADKMRGLTPIEIGRHLVKKVLTSIPENTHEHGEAVKKAAKIFHKSEASIKNYLQAVRKLSKKTLDDPTLSASQKQILSRLDKHEYQENAAELVRGKDVEATALTVDTMKAMEEAGVPPTSREETKMQVNTLAKIEERMKHETTEIVNWANTSLFKNTCSVSLVSIKRPKCSYAIKYISCPMIGRKTLCKKPCDQKSLDIPIKNCKPKINIAAEANAFYAALEKELKSKHRLETSAIAI